MSEAVGPARRPEAVRSSIGSGETPRRLDGWIDPILVLWALGVAAGFLWERVASSETFTHLRSLLAGG